MTNECVICGEEITPEDVTVIDGKWRLHYICYNEYIMAEHLEMKDERIRKVALLRAQNPGLFKEAGEK